MYGYKTKPKGPEKVKQTTHFTAHFRIVSIGKTVSTDLES